MSTADLAQAERMFNAWDEVDDKFIAITAVAGWVEKLRAGLASIDELRVIDGRVVHSANVARRAAERFEIERIAWGEQLTVMQRRAQGLALLLEQAQRDATPAETASLSVVGQLIGTCQERYNEYLSKWQSARSLVRRYEMAHDEIDCELLGAQLDAIPDTARDLDD